MIPPEGASEQSLGRFEERRDGSLRLIALAFEVDPERAEGLLLEHFRIQAPLTREFRHYFESKSSARRRRRQNTKKAEET